MRCCWSDGLRGFWNGRDFGKTNAAVFREICFMIETHYSQWLSQVYRSSKRVRYAFLADSEGKILARVGSKGSLDCSGVVDVSERPESIVSFYEANIEYEKEGDSFVPRLFGQGRANGALGIPTAGFLVGLYADMPIEIYEGSGGERVEWIVQFQAEMREIFKRQKRLE